MPTRSEIGTKDIYQGQVVVVRRDTREKIIVPIDEIATRLGEILETIQKDMYDRAKAFLDSHIDTAVTMDEMKEKFNENRGFIKAMWCGSEECEGEIKYETGGPAPRHRGEPPGPAAHLQDASAKKIRSVTHVFIAVNLRNIWFISARHIKIV